MTVGFPVNKNDIDSMVGQISVQLRDSISRVPGLKARIDAIPDAGLTTLGYTTDDITLLRAVLTDLLQIQQIAFGVTAQPTTYDFRTNIAKVTGIA